MKTIAYKKDAHIYTANENMRELGLIVKGSVRQVSGNHEMILETGNLLGLAGCDQCVYPVDYYAQDEVTICSFPYKSVDDLEKIITQQQEYGSVFILAALKQTGRLLAEYTKLCEVSKKMYAVAMESHRTYKYLCSKYSIPEQIFSRIDFLAPLEKRHLMETWKQKYYMQFCKFTLTDLKGLFTTKELCIGTILQMGQVMSELISLIDALKEYMEIHRSILLAPKKNDVFQLLFDLEVKTALIGKGKNEVEEAIDGIIAFLEKGEIFEPDEFAPRILEYEEYDFASVQESADSLEIVADGMDMETGESAFLGNSLEQILRFAEETPEQMLEFRERIAEYRELNDPYSTEEGVRRLRKNIATAFYRIYKKCVKRVLQRGETTRIVDMFLHFGYMDAALVGEDVAMQLEELLERLFECRSDKVYTFFSWLESIYKGEHEPSISELDMDYAAYLKDAVKSGNMSAADAEKNKDDGWMKVEYELDNIFQSLSKTISGKITTFCPILSEDDVISAPGKMLVTVRQIQDALQMVRDIDFGLFYREVMYSDEAHGLAREYINKEILPDIILFPISGNRGMMWQVTEGVRNNTASRIVLPILSASDIDDMIIENCGRFRWEMCRKVQGSRWNDIATPSLTSEYNDYIQYYKKNADLSTEAKEKIANALIRARNNYREVFVKDYENWIKYESKGSFRLNRVARGLLFTYCPFSAKLRDNIKDNPMFTDLIRKFDITTARKVKRLETMYQKYEKAGGEINEELQENIDFYSK